MRDAILVEKDVDRFPCHPHDFVRFLSNDGHIRERSAISSGVRASFTLFVPKMFIHPVDHRSLSDLSNPTLGFPYGDLVHQFVVEEHGGHNFGVWKRSSNAFEWCVVDGDGGWFVADDAFGNVVQEGAGNAFRLFVSSCSKGTVPDRCSPAATSLGSHSPKMVISIAAFWSKVYLSISISAKKHGLSLSKEVMMLLRGCSLFANILPSFLRPLAAACVLEQIFATRCRWDLIRASWWSQLQKDEAWVLLS